jgi:hypothetical protein
VLEGVSHGLKMPVLAPILARFFTAREPAGTDAVVTTDMEASGAVRKSMGDRRGF